MLSGHSMEDTIGRSDLLLLWMGPAPFQGDGDIVVLDPPEPEQGQYVSPAGYKVLCTDPRIGPIKIASIKRVVAQEGDRVELRLGVLTVNGQEVFAAAPEHRSTFDVPPIVVPPGHVFVLGDNRTGSCDSASYGSVPSGSIVGRVLGWVRLSALGALRSFFGV